MAASCVGSHSAAIALGSNLGDRFANIEWALRLLEAPDHIDGLDEPYATVVDTSFLYETEPMYETDQPKFINCACLVSLVGQICFLSADIPNRSTRISSLYSF